MNLEKLSRLRQGIYRFAGAGFSHPTPALIGVAEGTTGVLDAYDLFDFSFALDIADAIGQFASADLGKLSIAFVGVFEAGVGSVCPPFETAYVANPRTGDVAALQSDLKRTYLRYGLDPDSVSAGEIDHVSTELQVMAKLCSGSADPHSGSRTVDRSFANQKEFLEKHLLVWAPQFLDRVTSVDGHPAYTALSRGLRSFLAHESQLVPQLTKSAIGEAS